MCTLCANFFFLKKNALFFLLSFCISLLLADNESMGRSCDSSLLSRCQWTCKEARSRWGRWLHAGKCGRAVEIFKTVSSRAMLLLGGRHKYSWCAGLRSPVWWLHSQAGIFWKTLKTPLVIWIHFHMVCTLEVIFYTWSDDFKATRLGRDSFRGIIPGRTERRAQNHMITPKHISVFWLD